MTTHSVLASRVLLGCRGEKQTNKQTLSQDLAAFHELQAWCIQHRGELEHRLQAVLGKLERTTQGWDQLWRDDRGVTRIWNSTGEASQMYWTSIYNPISQGKTQTGEPNTEELQGVRQASASWDKQTDSTLKPHSQVTSYLYFHLDPHLLHPPSSLVPNAYLAGQCGSALFLPWIAYYFLLSFFFLIFPS